MKTVVLSSYISHNPQNCEVGSLTITLQGRKFVGCNVRSSMTKTTGTLQFLQTQS